MATEHTTNYQLSQWLGTDNFSRLDFNSDNLKIDNAMHAISGLVEAVPVELIASSVISSESRTMKLELGGIDLSQYLYLELVTDPVLTANPTLYHYLRFNGVSTNTYYKNGSDAGVNYMMRVDLAAGYPNKRTVRFAPYETSAKVCCSFASWWGDDVGLNIMRANDVTWANLTTINYDAASVNNSMQAGSGLYLFGVKKA